MTWGALVGTAVGAGADFSFFDGTAVGAAAALDAATALDAGAAGWGVEVAEEPQARIAANKRTKGPRIRDLGFLNQWLKMD